MKTLVWVEHDNASVKDATLAAVTAASQLGEVHLIVAGAGCAGVADEAAKIAGVGKVHLADNAAYANALAENVAPLIVELMGHHDAFVAPATLSALPGQTVPVHLELSPVDAAISVTVDAAPEGVTTSVDGSTLTLTLSATASAGPIALTAKRGAQERHATVQLALAKPFQPATRASELTVALERLFYADGEGVTATVDFGALTAPASVPDLIFSSAASRDVEHVKLVKSTGNTWRTERPLVVHAAATVQGDDALQLSPGDTFFVFYAVDHAEPALANVEATLVSDFAFLDGPQVSTTPSKVDARFALNAEEASSPRAVGTLAQQGSLPVQIAARELILTTSSSDETQRFLALTGGRVVDQEPLDETGTLTAVLVEVSPGAVMTPARTSRLRAFLGETGELGASTDDTAALYGLTLYARLEGFAASVNPRLQPDAAPTVSEAPLLGTNMMNLGVAGSMTCTPNSTSNPCVRSVPSVMRENTGAATRPP